MHFFYPSTICQELERSVQSEPASASSFMLCVLFIKSFPGKRQKAAPTALPRVWANTPAGDAQWWELVQTHEKEAQDHGEGDT